MGTMKHEDTGRECAAPAYGGGFGAVLHKRNSFYYENELRCVFWQPHIRNDKVDFSAQDIVAGHYVDVDLACLVDAVFIAPNAGTWFKELVESTISNRGQVFKVTRSVLAEEPVF